MSITVHLDQHIKTLAINQPERKNALNLDIIRALKVGIDESQKDGTRLIILTGTGTDFCAGIDLNSTAAGGSFDVTHYLRTEVNPLILAIQNSKVPVLAKVKGVAVGLGFSLALACDLILADETARFSQIFSQIGLATDGGSAYFLTRRLGYQKAFELTTLATMLDAQEAHRLGLINQLTTPENLDNLVDQFAQKLVNGAILAFQQIKENLQIGLNQSLEDTLDAEAVAQGKCFQTADFVEGVMAFMQKRKANFRGI